MLQLSKRFYRVTFAKWSNKNCEKNKISSSLQLIIMKSIVTNLDSLDWKAEPEIDHKKWQGQATHRIRHMSGTETIKNGLGLWERLQKVAPHHHSFTHSRKSRSEQIQVHFWVIPGNTSKGRFEGLPNGPVAGKSTTGRNKTSAVFSHPIKQYVTNRGSHTGWHFEESKLHNCTLNEGRQECLKTFAEL